MRWNKAAWAMLGAAATLAACSSSRVVHAPVGVTVGRQLIDLKQAHVRGALSDREYDQQRRQLIESVR